MNARATTLALVLAVAFASGCGDSDPAAPTVAGGTTTAAVASDRGRPVTDEQALVLARLLQQNWQRGGATFTGTIPVHGAVVETHGRVDFRAGRGEMTLTDPAGQSRRYAWTRRAVHAQAEPGAERYDVQAPDPDGDPVHAAIRFINLLSAETIDNTANIKDQDARFLRTETLAGTPVDVYRYGADGNTTYWIDRDDGLLRQVEATFPDDGRLTMTLTAHRPVRVTLPRSAAQPPTR